MTLPRYVALLRAIANVHMQPFRDAMEELGFTDVESYGATGNLLFNSRSANVAALERRITAKLGTLALVRTRSELARVIARDPFKTRTDAIVHFLTRAPTAARRREFLKLDFEPPAPVLSGRVVYYVWPARLKGRKTPLDFERALGVKGSFRTARVVRAIYARMSDKR